MIKIVDVKESFEKKNPTSIYDKKKKKTPNNLGIEISSTCSFSSKYQFLLQH